MPYDVEEIVQEISRKAFSTDSAAVLCQATILSAKELFGISDNQLRKWDSEVQASINYKEALIPQKKN